ncbi:hypothetical protein D3C87_1208910 [compost metagenome]|uniref:DUF2880 domain-containing protein n=1 Tax=Cupriavidus campinensis TaxID=151783 RepID=A0AAE9I2M7_9BURK|nr:MULTISPECIES: DUF2880 domain-containing protein [Cupriavidus]TSP13779.1 DUF2880 domain-containing protein [Cupriavidus campinensis]URF06573.1 DUF2880 domain-containing protein [Cupriavidus campinensis]CAG2141932.1 hypothetical protein LMG19282_02121 [Cupriavidus campinensis]
MTLPVSRQGRRLLVALAAATLPTFAFAAETADPADRPSAQAPVNIELGQRGGRPEAPEAPVACMEAVKAKLPNPERFRWVRGTTRRVAEDFYSVVGNVEFVNQAGEARKGDVQCDVMRAPGNQFIVPKIRLPQ